MIGKRSSSVFDKETKENVLSEPSGIT